MIDLAKGIIKFFRNLLTQWLEDFFIISGILVALITTYYTFGMIIGNYALAFILIIFGLLIAKRE